MKPLTGHRLNQIVPSMVQPTRASRTQPSHVLPWKKAIRVFFLWTLFLYPFTTANHLLYLIPQTLLFLVGGYSLVGDVPIQVYAWRKFDLVLLALAVVSFALAGELTSSVPEYSEVGKLTLNVATILLLLFLPGSLDLSQLARWLPRFALIWLSIIFTVYVRSGTTVLDLVLLFSSGTVSSSKLYGFAGPLGELFLTKNIAAMYIVAVYGLFLFGARSALQKTKLWQHLAFQFLICSFASRQGILSVLAMLGIARMCSGASRGRRWMEFALAGSVGVVVFLAAFNLNSSEDGANARLILWSYFTQHVWGFLITGQGLHALNESLAPLEIDNYHMFFMNQIGVYGLIHCLAFNSFLVVLMLQTKPSKYIWLLIAPYWLNVCFQTYGYEYGNLFLFVVAADRFRYYAPRIPDPAAKSRLHPQKAY